VAAIVAVTLVATITFFVLQRIQTPAPGDNGSTAATPSTPGRPVAAPPASVTTTTTTPMPPPFAASNIDQVLLTPDELNSILGTYANSGTARVGLMKVDRSTYGMADNSNLVKPPSCVGLVFGAEHEVYSGTNFTAMRDQTFIPEPYVYNATGAGPKALEQTAIVFPSTEQAQAVVASAQDRWRTCAAAEVYQSVPPESGYTWKLGGVSRLGDLLSVPMAANGALLGPRACQQVLGVRKNVVVGVHSCNDVNQSFATYYDEIRQEWPIDLSWATNDAERLASAMLNKIGD
jgi:serine/threonine-protein kinase